MFNFLATPLKIIKFITTVYYSKTIPHKNMRELKKCPVDISLCTKDMLNFKEAPCGYTIMHKKCVQFKEIPCGYTIMYRKHVQY